MSRRPIVRFRPALERVEPRILPGVGTPPASGRDAPAAAVRHRQPTTPGGGFLAFRVTQKPYTLIPPFQQVLVQDAQPVPGQVYNVCYVALKNMTAQTFDASSGFTVRLNNQTRSHAYPILTGSQQWKPEEVFVFYVLTKKYYPVSFVSGGFQFNLGGRSSTLPPGPSGIFLRLTYRPETFARTLDWIVAFGPGAQQGKGPQFGLPDTAINGFVSAKTRRIDFAGHF
ncbi:MAG: hypothetical protein U0790_05365 [Isosphaeraceae bacterium]